MDDTEGTNMQAMLEAADVLASILQHEAMSDVALAARDVYEEAKGA